jgi:hypothetical protein
MSAYKLIDAAQARTKLEAHIAQNKRQLAAVKAVIESLKTLEGTILTWRLAKKLEKLHPELKFKIDDSMPWYQLYVDGDFKTARLNMGYKGHVVGVNVEEVIKQNQAYLLDEQRIPQYEKELETVEERVARYNAALVEIRAAHEGLGEGGFSFNDNNKLSVKTADDKWYID